MKKMKRLLFCLTVPALLALAFSGCGKKFDDSPFEYSESLDAEGFYKGIKALDYVTLFNHRALYIPAEVHFVTQEDVQYAVDEILSSYPVKNIVTDRPVRDGDTVNIDYVGSVDGEIFAGGSTGGSGTDVIIGETQYIDDFLYQLIGHMPGETVEVEVTFPSDYGAEELAGKDALFVTVINHIVEEDEAVLTDAYVAETFAEQFGWTTVAGMREDVANRKKNHAIRQYVQQYILNEVQVKSIPSSLIKYQERQMVYRYREQAAYYGIDFDEFLEYEGFANVDELVKANEAGIRENAVYYLVSQAVAEDARLLANDIDISTFFMTNYDTYDYSYFEGIYGLPYLRQIVLSEKVVEHIVSNAVLG